MPPKIKNFTPVLDSLVTRYGLITAAVWGRVWRYEQGNDGFCRASMATLADGLGISPRTVMRHIEVLIAEGYLIDHTPDRKHKPHKLTTTPKARLEVTVDGTDQGMTESHTSSPEGMTESQTGMTESHRRYDRESLKETIKKQNKKQTEVKGERESHELTGNSTPPPDFRNLSPKEVRRIPEIAVYIEVTGRYPGRPQQPIIFETIRKHQFKAKDLEPFWREWAGVNGYQPHKLAWLTEWAVKGEIPGKAPAKTTGRKTTHDANEEAFERVTEGL